MTASGRIPLALSAAALLLLPLGAVAQIPSFEPPGQAPAPSPAAAAVRLDLPLVGAVTAGGTGTFSGTLTLERFAEQNGQVAAVGTISGILAAANGVAGSVFQGLLSLPVTLTPGTAPAAVSFGPSPPPSPVGADMNGLVLAQALQVCAPLHLEIGAVSLNVLGVTVATGPVVLDVSGAGNATGALGALVCQVPATAGSVPGLVALLNQILAALAV